MICSKMATKVHITLSKDSVAFDIFIIVFRFLSRFAARAVNNPMMIWFAFVSVKLILWNNLRMQSNLVVLCIVYISEL